MLELEKKVLKQKLGDIVSFSVDMKDYSSIKIGGKAFALCSPRNEKELKLCVKTLTMLNIKFRVIGAGSNILFSSNLLKFAFITTINMTCCKVDIKKQCLYAMAGDKLSKCYNMAQSFGLSGFESLAFIPATIGGAIVNNAGAFGVEIKDILEHVKVLMPNGKLKILHANELGFKYRFSNLKNSNMIVVSAIFKLNILARSVIAHIAKEYLGIRSQTQPVGLSLGSVFKKVNNISAGKFIDEAGLKNYKIGGCMVSEKHANFILNIGGAKPSDFKRLVLIIQKEVYKKFKIRLETEVEYI